MDDQPGSRTGRTAEPWRDLIECTPPWRDRREFVAQCLSGVQHKTQRGVDLDAFPNRREAVNWRDNHPASENPEADVLTPVAYEEPYAYRLLECLVVLCGWYNNLFVTLVVMSLWWFVTPGRAKRGPYASRLFVSLVIIYGRPKHDLGMNNFFTSLVVLAVGESIVAVQCFLKGERYP